MPPAPSPASIQRRDLGPTDVQIEILFCGPETQAMLDVCGAHDITADIELRPDGVTSLIGRFRAM